MSEYDNTNSGTFFVNDRKEKPNHPDYSGKINVEGNEYYLKGCVSLRANKSTRIRVEASRAELFGFQFVDSDPNGREP